MAPTMVATATNALFMRVRRACTRRMVSSARGLPEDLLHLAESVHAFLRAFGVHVAVALGVGSERGRPLPGRAGHLLRVLLRHLRRARGPADQDPVRAGPR